MNPFRNRLKKVHLLIFGGFALVFSGLTLWAVLHMSPGDWNDWRGNHPYVATLLTISGPFTGWILRPYEPSCWKVAWGLFPFCAAFLLCGTVCQIIPLPFQRGAAALRIAAWVLGLLGWFLGGLISLIFAMD